MVKKATSEEWLRYYAQATKRRGHGANDPIEIERVRRRVRERATIVVAAAGLVGALAAYLVVLG
jgi:hypothetical protein